MPTKDEQFSEWFENAPESDLYEAMTPDKREALEQDFLESSAFETAQRDYIHSELASCSEMDWFDESIWYDPEAVDSPDDEADLGGAG